MIKESRCLHLGLPSALASFLGRTPLRLFPLLLFVLFLVLLGQALLHVLAFVVAGRLVVPAVAVILVGFFEDEVFLEVFFLFDPVTVPVLSVQDFEVRDSK
jgi:hypothetical protein